MAFEQINYKDMTFEQGFTLLHEVIAGLAAKTLKFEVGQQIIFKLNQKFGSLEGKNNFSGIEGSSFPDPRTRLG